VTYSIVARDGDTGAVGVAVQTHNLAVGAVCSFAESGIGAVATQSIARREYGPEALAAMRAGVEPALALARLTAVDDGAALRQVAMVDASGRVAAHTGDHCIAHAGHATGDGFSCQANMMRDEGVPEAMAAAFEASTGDLVDRLLVALDAAEAAGGDIRGGQSAALIVAGGERIDLRVDDHATPLVELRRLVDLRRGSPEDVERLARGNPEGWFWAGIGMAHEGDVDGAKRLLARAYAVHPGWRELVLRLPAAGLLAAALAEVLTGPGTPS
jgi:uncharacterized Ntn-hydrolase superfamily protein